MNVINQSPKELSDFFRDALTNLLKLSWDGQEKVVRKYYDIHRVGLIKKSTSIRIEFSDLKQLDNLVTEFSSSLLDININRSIMARIVLISYILMNNGKVLYN